MISIFVHRCQSHHFISFYLTFFLFKFVPLQEVSAPVWLRNRKVSVITGFARTFRLHAENCSIWMASFIIRWWDNSPPEHPFDKINKRVKRNERKTSTNTHTHTPNEETKLNSINFYTCRFLIHVHTFENDSELEKSVHKKKFKQKTENFMKYPNNAHHQGQLHLQFSAKLVVKFSEHTKHKEKKVHSKHKTTQKKWSDPFCCAEAIFLIR